MARLRFPGRPGHRFDRLSLKYFADDIKNSQDPSLAFLPQFQHGLKTFRDIVGLSDEDDEFEGFTFKELKHGEKRLSLFNKEQQKKKEEQEAPLSETGGAAMYHASTSQSLPTAKKARVKTKIVVEKAVKNILEEDKSAEKTENHSVKIKGAKIFGHRKKPKKFKLDYKHGLHDVHLSESKSKKSDMDMAKFLLEKAKQANKLQEQAKARRLAAAKRPVQVQKKEFVLPTQSSRSSRVIKPNKRFLELDSVNTAVIKKSKPDELIEVTPEKLQSKSITTERKKSIDSFRPSFSGSPNSIGLLDQPLIVDGKRDRKPSLKLQMSDDESSLFSPTKSAMTSPLAAPKLGTSLFSQSQFTKASEKQKFSMMGFGASRLHGTSIVQKAKLQLNRAALNKSKAALARSLKAEMKREAKFAEQAMQFEVEVSQPKTVHKPSKEKGSEKKKLKKKKCAVCGKKTDLVVCYDKIVACLSCRRFYKECNCLISSGTFTTPQCMQNDKCKLIPDRIKCRFCRIRKVLKVGFPPLPQLSELFKDENGVEKPAVVEEPELPEPESITSPPVKKGIRIRTPVQSPVPVTDSQLSFTTPPPVQTPDEATSKEQELSPLKAGEGSEKRQRKKRAFKELLRNKQEKVEETEPVHQEKPAILEPPPVVATGSVEISPCGGPGPRIKHVCRNAAVVLGQPLATFPEKSELRLSALPTKDKVQLWKKDEESKAANEESDDDRPMEEIIQQSGDSVVIVKKSPTKSKTSKKLTGAGGLHLYKRKMRCRQCPGCLRDDCGTCRHCLDMKKFGGPGTIKKACVERRCSNPLIQRSATEAFIDEKKKNIDESGVDCNKVGPERTRIVPETDLTDDHSKFTPDDGLEPVIPGSEVTPTVSGLETQTGTLLEDEAQSNNNVAEKTNENIPSVSEDKPSPVQAHSQTYSLETRQKTSARGQSSEVRKLTFEELPNFQLERISSRNKESGKISSKLMKKLEIQQKYSKKEGGNDGQCYPVTLQSVLPASRQWGSLLSQPKYYPIKVDFKGKCDLGSAWNYGMALTMSTAMSVRTLCFLCGSAGKHELIYCNICCEPFHEFCLEDWEQPSPDHYDDWICAACQFCHVCGRQNNLLQCDKCQNTYHPGCLGPNYPTKPSKRKNIWICTKCVKCRSCGATTPGSDSQATWTYDFSLCFECGQLMDKGNFCPICRKCYSDDDWESKMIQCNKCDSWVHSKCEGLTDEMYEILSYLPEDLSFYCRKCFPVGCPEWESTLKRELRSGLENILQSLILSKSSQYILKQEKRTPPKQSVLPSHQNPEKTNNSCALTNKNNVEATQERVKRNIKNFEKIKQLLKGGSGKELTNCVNEEVDPDDVKLDRAGKESGESGLESDRTPVQTGIDQHCDLTSNNTPVAMETDNYSGENTLSRTRSDVAADNLTKNVENVIALNTDQKIKQSCDRETETLSDSCTASVSYSKSGSCNVGSDLGQCGPGQVKDKPVICDKPAVCDDDVVQDNKKENMLGTVEGNNGNKYVCNTDKCDTSSGDNLCSTENDSAGKLKINCSENMAGDIKDEGRSKNEGEVVNSIESVDGLLSDNLNAAVNAQDRSDDSSGKNKIHDNKTDSMEIVVRRSRDIVSRSHHVQFNVKDNKSTRDTGQDPQIESNHPKDLMEIAQKMKTGDYKSVAVFCEDILRVIQTYLDNEEEGRTSRKKATQSAKSIFVKLLEKIFPWFNVKNCQHWYSMKSLPDGMLHDATLPPSTDHTYAQWLERVETPRSPQPSPFKRRMATPVKKYMPIDEEDFDLGQLFEGDDERKCMFCHIFGDQEANDAGRLLYCGQDDWCHVNCALWSAEVYEDADGELLNLVEAFSRGKMLKCDLCGRAGATVGCNTKGCKANYHFMCARRDQCRFQEDKKVFCKMHRMYIDAELLTADRFIVLRRAYVGTLFVRSVKKRWSKGLHCGDVSVLMGSCCMESLGRLTDLSDKPKFLQPVDFVTTRMYWSTKDARRRCIYTCRIVEVRPQALKSPTVTIKDTRIIHDQNHPDFVPFTNLDLTGISSVSEQQSLSVPTMDLTADTVDLTINTVDLSETLSADENTMDTSCDKSHLPELSVAHQNEPPICHKVDESIQRRGSFSGLPSEKEISEESEKLSMSWPSSNMKSSAAKPIQADLSFLSPQTLKMLNIKDPNKFVKPVQSAESEHEEFSLLKVADRLNRAAAKSARRKSEEGSSPLLARSEGNSPLPFRAHSRSPSMERGDSPMLNRPFSPIACVRQRSQSVDRKIEVQPYKPALNVGNKFSSVLSSLPAKPFSPPARLYARSNSLSIERELSSSESTTKTSVTGLCAPLLPHIQGNSQCLKRGRSVSDPIEVVPKPVSFSSPVASKVDVQGKKLVLSDISTDYEESESINSNSQDNTTSAGTESQVTETDAVETGNSEKSDITETDNQSCEMITESECVDLSEDSETVDETTETIVVMTESGESLSEEDAIKIVQDMIEHQNSSLETDDHEKSAEIGNSLDSNSDTGSKNGLKDDYVDADNQNNEHPDSPFIPQIENECIDTQRVRRNTGDKRVDKNVDRKNVTEKETTLLHESQSEIVGKDDDSVTADASLDSKNEEEKVILINNNSDTDSDNDITDITDSVVAARPVNQESECKTGENKMPDLQSQAHFPKTDRPVNQEIECETDENKMPDLQSQALFPETVRPVNQESECETDENKMPNLQSQALFPEAEGNKDLMKRIVYDLDESIDSDIELLDDLDMIDNEETNSVMICENTDTTDHDSSNRIRELETADSASIENENTVKHTDTKKEYMLVNTMLENKTCMDDEIDGDTSKLTGNLKQLVETVDKGMVKEKNDIPPTDSFQHSEEADADSDLLEKESTETENCEENLDSSKEEVLRGLGLGTLDEVEKLKNSPQKSPRLPILTIERKKKCQKNSTVKSYPLRKNMTSQARLGGDVITNSKSGNKDESASVNDVKGLNKEINKELSPELPVLDPIAKKIKEESIAKSCPEEKGPFKCSKCRRQYRTETSYLIHVENCNFLVSSSDEDTNQDDEDSKVKSEPKDRRRTRSKANSLNDEKDHKKESICSSDDNTENKRTTLRRSTQFQRVAIEVAEKRQQEEENPKRGRGRPSLKPKDSLESDKDKHQKELMTKETFASKICNQHSSESPDLVVKKGRGRPRKSEITFKSMEGEPEGIEFEEETISVRETRRKSRETKIMEKLSQSSDSELDERHDQDINGIKRKRGRPKKVDCNSGEPQYGKNADEKPPVAKRKFRNNHEIDVEKHFVKENSVDMTYSCSNFQQVKDDLKSQIEKVRTSRYRPSKMVHMKTRNKTIRIYVKDNKRSRDGNNKFGLKAVSIRLQKADYIHRHKADKAEKKNSNDEMKKDDTISLHEGKCLTETYKPKGRGRPPLQRKPKTEDDCNLKEESCEKQNDIKKEEVGKGKQLQLSSLKNKTCKKNKIDQSSEKDKNDDFEQGMNVKRKDDNSANFEDGMGNDTDLNVEKPDCSDKGGSILGESSNIDEDQEQVCSDGGSSILDESTGWIINKRTGEMIRSPKQIECNKNQCEHQNSCNEKGVGNETLDEKKMSDFVQESSREEFHSLQKGNAVDNNTKDDLKDDEVKVHNVNTTGKKDQENKDTVSIDCLQVEEYNDNECITEMEVEENTENSVTENRKVLVENAVGKKPLDVEESIDEGVVNETNSLSASEVKAVSEQGAIQSMEFKDDADNLPNTVLKLLKEGHKVVIRNPKLNKCFMWQKTVDGYIGKPFDKKLAKSPPLGQKHNTDSSQMHNSDTNSSDANSISESNTDSQVPKARLQTASDILMERKKSELVQAQQKQYPETSSFGQSKEKIIEKPELLNRKAKFVVENIERLIETNKKVKAKSSLPDRFPMGSAEYVGGILISAPKSVSVDEVKQTIQNTAPIATNMLQNSLLQNKLTSSYQSGIQALQNNLSSAVQTAVQSAVPMATQSSYPIVQQQLQTGSVRMFTQTDLQNVSQTALQPFAQVSPQSITPAGYSNISMNNMQSMSPISPQYTPQIVQPQLIQQSYQPVQVQQVAQIPSLEMGMVNVPVMTSVGFPNAQLVQSMSAINPNVSQPFLNTNALQSLVYTQSSTSLVNTQISEPLMNAQTPQTSINQYITQSLLNPQPSQPMGNQFVSQPQSSVVSQLRSQLQMAQTFLNQQASQLQSSQTNLNHQSDPQSSFAKLRPIYNQTQIVNKTSSSKAPYQNNLPKTLFDSDLKTVDRKNTYSVLKQNLTSQLGIKKSDSNVPFLKVFPGLGGGSNTLIKKMHTYLASKRKLPLGLDTSPKHRKIKPYSIMPIDANGVITVKKQIVGIPGELNKPNSGSTKKQMAKRRYVRKAKLKREISPRKLRRPYRKRIVPSGIALPHKSDKASHPMIHGPKEVTSLPVAAVEEEVRDVPLSALDDMEGRHSGLDGTGQNLGHLEYQITSDDGFSCRSDTLDGAWKQVTEKVQDARTAGRLKHLSYAGLSGLQMFGLSHPSVVYLVEQLYGASYCRRYKFKYHRHEMVERELELLNPTGCIRTEPFSGRNPSDMFSFLMSRYRTLPEYCGQDIDEEIAMKSSRRATSMDLPMAMRFRKLKGFSKECVGVYRSTIHGRGLFCKRSIDAGEMIIEYAGEVIRNSMTDIREKYYESKGIGCYMFRIDDTDVVDATMKGSAARFINHSCDPNCYSKVITVDNRKHIVIFAMRKILRGEELTYDYKFPIEEIKIPCTCGSKRCRRYLN